MTFRSALLIASAAAVIAACTSQDAEDTTASNQPVEAGELQTEEEDVINVTGALAAGGDRDGRAEGYQNRRGVLALEAEPAPAATAGIVGPSQPQMRPQPLPGDIDRERYEEVETNPIKLVSEEPVSTFSVDVDTASYAVARRYLQSGEAPPSDAIRVEELINYFDYDYALPDSRQQPFSVNAAVAPTPWNENTEIIHIGLQGYDIELEERPRANLVFLIDVSGSMEAEDKLPLLKQSLRMLVDQMTDEDTVSIVVYAGAAGAVLEPTPGSERQRIYAALESLSAGGSTAGGEGMRLAYSLAEQNFDEDALNRVILATDGDFNVGVTSDQRLEDFVADKRETGIYLSVLGFGRGNYNDQLMQTIAQAGNGTAAYIDSLNEARKVLHDEMAGALFPIANDVKIQVEFNPARVAEYRLIGYETRMLRREDFNNDQVDAGEIGAGHEVTAVYEIAAPDSDGRRIEESRYAAQPELSGVYGDEIGFLRVRYKLPGEDESRLIEQPITHADQGYASIDEAPQETRWVAAVAAYGQLLRRDPYTGEFDFGDVIELAQSARGEDAFGYRAEFVQLARLAESAVSLRPLEVAGAGN
ncbi:MAG: VWA domain-containing protein [Maricaulaceae bacterium]|jgi:Ca-activated chloride channel family protein